MLGYNWSKMFNSVTPKGNTGKITGQSAKDITNGAIIYIIGIVIAKISAVGIGYYAAIKATSWLFGNSIYNPVSSNLAETITSNMPSYVVGIILSSIIPIAIIVFVNMMKDKEQVTIPYFVILLLAMLQLVYCAYTIIPFIIQVAISPIFVLIGLISSAVIFFGNVSIAVGCIDFCQQVTDAYKPPVASKAKK